MVRITTFPLVGKKFKLLSAMIPNMLSIPFSPSREVRQNEILNTAQYNKCHFDAPKE